MRVGGAVGVEDEDAVVFDQAAQVQQVDQDGGRANQNVWESGGVNLSKIAREEAVLFCTNASQQSDIRYLLCFPHSRLEGVCFDIPLR